MAQWSIYYVELISYRSKETQLVKGEKDSNCTICEYRQTNKMLQ